MARGWRSGSKARAARLGRDIGVLPSIDDVECYLRNAPMSCAYCARRLSASKAGQPNMDHRLPIARGGDANITNLVISCGPCNRAKGEMTEAEFHALRALVSSWEDKGKDLFRRLKLGWFSH